MSKKENSNSDTNTGKKHDCIIDEDDTKNDSYK